MKKTILLITLILFSVNCYAWNPFKSKKEVESEEIEVAAPKVFHKLLSVHTYEDKSKVFYVYRIVENDVIQIGVIDEKSSQIHTVKNSRISGSTVIWHDESAKLELIEEHFPNLTDLDFLRQN